MYPNHFIVHLFSQFIPQFFILNLVTMTSNQSLDPYGDFAMNNTKPFYLYPGESPAVVLVTPLLEGTKNFQSWIISTRVALVCKNKIKFVDGTIPTLENKTLITTSVFVVIAWFWIGCNDRVRLLCKNLLFSFVLLQRLGKIYMIDLIMVICSELLISRKTHVKYLNVVVMFLNTSINWNPSGMN